MIIALQERLAVTPDLYQKYNVSIPNHVFFIFTIQTHLPQAKKTNWQLHTGLSTLRMEVMKRIFNASVRIDLYLRWVNGGSERTT